MKCYFGNFGEIIFRNEQSGSESDYLIGLSFVFIQDYSCLFAKCHIFDQIQKISSTNQN